MAVTLCVEDDEATSSVLKGAFAEVDPSMGFFRVADGEQAIAFLDGRAPFEDAPRPDLVFLDMRLPKKNGIDVLTHMRGDASLAGIATVIFTSSVLSSERAQCLALGVKAYLIKPKSYSGVVDAVRSACAKVLS